MKKLKLLFVLLCFVFADLPARSSPARISFTIARKGFGSSYILRCTGANAGIVVVTIHNSEGHLMIQKKVRSPQLLSFTVDFLSMPEGLYKVTINDGLNSCTLIVHYTTNMSLNYALIPDTQPGTYFYIKGVL